LERERGGSTWPVITERGGGWCLLIIPILIATRFHPTSSFSWRQLGVLSWWWSSGSPYRPGLVAIITLCCCRPVLLSPCVVVTIVALCCCCRHHPVLLLLLLPCIVVAVVTLHCHSHHSTHYPPHEQLLVRLGVGGVSFLVRMVVVVMKRPEF
jgi:hypothetical protein